MKSKNINTKNLIWVYPPNNWISNYKRTFVYGWVKPKTKLFISVETLHQQIKVFPNGNFAQMVKLPFKNGNIQLTQVLKNGKKKVVSRVVIVREKTNRIELLGLRNEQNRFNSQSSVLNPQSCVIVIDPGHGGKEHGTHSPKGIPEKHFNLQVAKLLYEKLNKLDDKKVYLTRTKDKFVSLKQRVAFAKKKKCNLLISIHHNALPDYENPLKHKGVGIYYTHDFVKPLTRSLLKNISKEAKLKKYGIFKRNFALTKPDFCHAVLIECGFLIHPEESEHITQRKTQEKIVNGIIKVISSQY